MYSNTMKSFEEYKQYTIDYKSKYQTDIDEEAEVSGVKSALKLSKDSWLNKVIEQNVEDWSEVAYMYAGIDDYQIDNINYEDAMNLGTLALIAGEMYSMDRGEIPETQRFPLT